MNTFCRRLNKVSPVYFSTPGVFCSAGKNIDELWNNVLLGNQSGIKRVKALNGKEFYAARIDDSLLKKTSARYDMRIIQIEEQALSQIEKEINLVKEKYGTERIGVCVGSCDNGTEFSLKGHREYFKNGKFPKDYSLEIQCADYVATFISEKYELKGPSLCFETACSSSAGAIIKAAELIRSGVCDAVVAGGIDIASDTVLMGFDSLEAVSSEITNPFSKNRHGITLGEAGAFFVITKEPIQNDLPIQLLGYGESADAYHMTSPDPSGNGAFRAMENALKNSRIALSEIDYVNLHGTGTKYNDSMEAKAVSSVFADFKVPVSTTKAITGHTLGASGALEIAICYAAIKNNQNAERVRLPLQVWDKERDLELPELNFVDSENTKNTGKVKVCLSNSFAFGGANSSLIIGIK